MHCHHSARASGFPLLALALALSAACLSPALARQSVDAAGENATPAPSDPKDPTPSHARGAAGPVTTLDAIGVTGWAPSYAASDSVSATRTDTPLIEVPQSVQVITRALIDEQDRRTLADALVNVSGVTPTKTTEVLFTTPIVRGFPAEIYLDGLPTFGTTASNDPTSLVGLERVEVLKGPTSTLYGGGVGAPLGGLINLVSKTPEATPSGLVGLRTGSYSTAGSFVDLNLPLGDRVAGRLAAEYQRNGSWIDHVKGSQYSVQPSFAFQLAPRTELLLRGQYDKRSQREYSGLPAAQALAGRLDRDAYPGATSGQPQTTVENQVTTLRLNHAFSDDTRLSVTAHHFESRIRDYGSFVYPEVAAPDPATPTVYPIFGLYLPTTTRENTLDANLSSTFLALGGRHELLGGFNYDVTRLNSAVSGAVPLGYLDLANPRYGLDYGPTPQAGYTQTNRYETTAVYLQDQATYGRLHLLGAVRLTQLRMRQDEQNLDTRYRRVTPRLGLTYDLADGVAAYAAYGAGFRGAVSFVGLKTPKPETSRNYEAGFKLALKDIGLSGTIAAFEQTRRNVTTPDPDPSHLGYSIQSGEQRARGVETDLVWEPTRALSLLFTYAYTQARVTQDTAIPVGDRLPRVPRHSARLAARYRVQEGPARGLAFGAGITAVSARDITLPNSVSVPGYALLDAQASYGFDRYTVALSAVNLANRKVYDTYQYLSFPVVMPVQPRSVYLTVSAQF
ncbi:TonB-dependent siderophore receptor [Achromobacter insuavis]|uniref:TonB-dependent siderophore receptor n=2 Tax=Achromobacter insuavis TaxID=1287735 RepID=UPI001F12FA11|nr:TonB-dependent siderophore receptor [Achromobacter insuavis]